MPDSKPKHVGPSRHLRLQAVVFTVVVVSALALPIALRPNEAKALFFPVAQPVVEVASPWDKIWDGIQRVFKAARDLAFKNALKVYLTKVAEDTAVWLASAGTGQKPLFVTDPHYWKNLTDAAAGDFLDTLATNTFGVNVCAPADIRTQFSIESAVKAIVDPANFCSNQCKSNQNEALNTDTFVVGHGVFTTEFVWTLPQAQDVLDNLKGAVASGINPNSMADGFPGQCPADISIGDCINVYEADIQRYKQVVNQDYRLCLNLCSAKKRVARCTFSQIQANMEKLGGQIKNKDFIPKFTAYFEPGENDIGQILTLVEQAADAKKKAKEEDEATRLGVQPKKDPITGEVKTPPELTKKAAEGLAEDPSGKVYEVYTGSPIADAIGVFTNTLTKRLLKRIFERGFNPKTESPSFLVGGGIDQGISGMQAARAVFATLAKPDFNDSGGSSVTLAELAACPDTDPGPNNCVLDEGFRQAIEQQLTVKEAVDQKLLNPNVAFGFKYDATLSTNVEPDFREGYPYRSLLILRRLRVIPVGWELAAQRFRDVDPDPQMRTLGKLLEAYGQCGQGGSGPSPYCGLVDPNWVLKAPETFCRLAGPSAAFTSFDYIPDPLFPEAPQVRLIGRAETCADEQSCLEEDENGNCLAYGYCIKERPSWKFGGDQCTNAYHSCINYADPNGIETAYLSNSLDYEGCKPENAGCKWYCTEYDEVNGQFTCTASTGFKDFFTSQVKSCPAGALGCTEYIRSTNTSNLVANGGFEILGAGNVVDDGASDSFPGWVSTGVVTEAVSESNSGGVGNRAQGNAGQEIQSQFDARFPLNGQVTTLTFYGRAATGACAGSFGMRTTAGGSDYFIREPFTLTEQWQRYAAILTYDPTLTYDTNIITSFFELSGCAAILDDVQMEFGQNFSEYKEYGSMNTVYLNGDRVSCRPEEVGCDLYTSARDRIPGIVTSQDYCPENMVGCRAFLEVPVTNNGADPNHPVRTGKRCSLDQSISCFDDGDCAGAGSCLPSVSLIPSTGTTCAATYVGCEEYTNLDEVALGGEGKEYYTYIRECVKPNGNPNNEKTFYTWIGSEETGFQLKAYLLKPTPDPINEAGDTVGGGPAYVPGTDATQCTQAIYDAGENPDCRKFYDAELNIFYRLYSRTITVSIDCHPLRNTIDSVTYNAIPSEGTTCPASAAQCREYRGASGFNTRTILSDNFDDGDTAGWDGGTWSTESLIFGGGSAYSGGTFQTNATYSVPEELENGRSYIVTFWAGSGNAGSDNATLSARFGASPPGESFEGTADLRWDDEVDGPQWNFYTLGPLHLNREPELTDHLQFALSGGSAYFIDTIKFYEVADNVYMTKGSAQLCTGNENCDLYRNRDGKTLPLKSFTRLCSEDKIGCEALINTQNSDSPFGEQFANGTNRDGTEPKTVPGDVVELIVNDRSHYCREEEQGCTRYGAPTFGVGGAFCSNDPAQACTNDIDCGAGNSCIYQDVGIAKYDMVFFANDPDEYATTLCRLGEVGCEAWMNKVTGAAEYFRRPEPFTCDYKTVKIGSESFTNWYVSGTSGLKSGDDCPVISPAPPASGGKTPVAPYYQPTGVCKNNPAQLCTIDADCGASECVHWVGICPKEQSGCKEYRDTDDPSACRAECLLTFDRYDGTPIPVDASCLVDTSSVKNGCRGYWYLQQSVEDNASECSGTIDPNIGCLKFFSPDP